MRYAFEEEFRLDHPETVGETDSHFDLDNYKDWLEAQLAEARKKLTTHDVVVSLLERAASLVGNPATNISGSTDLACDEWQKDYKRWRDKR